ncbi:hypothetical protein CCUS01_02490 [Colletotrichum cuscutae]|uniref:Uncharacterized protein n=1 Tax=Colletotrichum cuscutae TaxID=1209917 RepID=A0AAI9TW45_9PEZI|nr:hypothetical protein CCUS01_02490 [Colletotrichum cuscutae]
MSWDDYISYYGEYEYCEIRQYSRSSYQVDDIIDLHNKEGPSPSLRRILLRQAHNNAPAKFAQIIDHSEPMLYEVTEDQLLHTSFGDICPSGNYYSRQFLKASTQTNLEFSKDSATAEESVNFTPYFSTNDSRDLFKVAASIASCFAATCEQTRKPTLFIVISNSGFALVSSPGIDNRLKDSIY